MELRLGISNPVGILSFLQSNRKLVVTKVIHKSRNLIGTLGGSEFGPKQGQVFRVILIVSVDRSAITKSKEHMETRDSR